MNAGTGYVLDASVLVARLRASEPAYKVVRALMMALVEKRTSLYVPAIALAEVAAALSRSGTDRVSAITAAREIGNLPGLQIVSIDAILGDLACTVAAAQRIRGCDAIYVALALTLGVHLITLDRQQRDRVPGVVVAQAPADALATL